MSKTTDHLKDAFAGESQANRKYLAFAKKADTEGYPQIAKLFRAVAHAETIHAHNHLRELGEIKDTAENLKAAMAGENYEVTTMYPAMMEDAKLEDMKKVHEALYHQALEGLGKDGEAVTYYVCPICGYTHAGPMTEKCPVCGAPGEKFEKID